MQHRNTEYPLALKKVLGSYEGDREKEKEGQCFTEESEIIHHFVC